MALKRSKSSKPDPDKKEFSQELTDMQKVRDLDMDMLIEDIEDERTGKTTPSGPTPKGDDRDIVQEILKKSTPGGDDIEEEEISKPKNDVRKLEVGENPLGEGEMSLKDKFEQSDKEFKQGLSDIKEINDVLMDDVILDVEDERNPPKKRSRSQVMQNSTKFKKLEVLDMDITPEQIVDSLTKGKGGREYRGHNVSQNPPKPKKQPPDRPLPPDPTPKGPDLNDM